MSPYRIPFNRPVEIEGASEALGAALARGLTTAGGPFGRRCEERLGALVGAPVLLTSSCTHALEMAALLLEIVPGDEVIVPSFAFVSTANAFALRGARIRYADCDGCGNIDLDHVRKLITTKTRAVVPVHYGGNSCDVAALRALCEEAGAALVEDAAQCIGARYRGKHLGSFGALGTLSFHETKNVGCGQGGALIVADKSLLTRAHHLREKGTNRWEFGQGRVNKYTWVDLGSSWGLSDLNAAYLSLQLERLEKINARRGALWERYRDELAAPVAAAGAEVLGVPPGCEPNHHLFALLWPSRARRDACIAHLAGRSILAPFHYVALHDSPYGRRFAEAGETLPMSERLSNCLMRLPLFYNLSDADQGEVIAAVREFCGR